MKKFKQLLFLTVLFFSFCSPLSANNRIGDKVKIYLKNNAVIIGKITKITPSTIYVHNKYALFPVKIKQIKKKTTLKKALIGKPIKKVVITKKTAPNKKRPRKSKFVMTLSAGYPFILNSFSQTLTPKPGLFLSMGIKLKPMTLSAEFGFENYKGKDNANNKLLIFSFSANANLFFLKKIKLQIGMLTGIGTSYITASLPDDNIEAAGARFHFQIGPLVQYNITSKMNLFLKLPFTFYVENSSTLSVLQIKSGVAYVF